MADVESVMKVNLEETIDINKAFKYTQEALNAQREREREGWTLHTICGICTSYIIPKNVFMVCYCSLKFVSIVEYRLSECACKNIYRTHSDD